MGPAIQSTDSPDSMLAKTYMVVDLPHVVISVVRRNGTDQDLNPDFLPLLFYDILQPLVTSTQNRVSYYYNKVSPSVAQA
jgi:hypothetical protein